MDLAVVSSMSTTRQAEKGSANETQTQQASPFAPATTPRDTLYPGLSKAGPRQPSAHGKRLLRSDFDGSIWGWARMTASERDEAARLDEMFGPPGQFSDD